MELGTTSSHASERRAWHPFFRTRLGRRGFDIRFAYSAWRYFLQWTIEIRGRPLFQKLLLGFMDRPAEAEQVFRDVYGEDLSIAVFQFDATVRAGSTP